MNNDPQPFDFDSLLRSTEPKTRNEEITRKKESCLATILQLVTSDENMTDALTKTTKIEDIPLKLIRMAEDFYNYLFNEDDDEPISTDVDREFTTEG